MKHSNQTNQILLTMYKEGKIDKNQISYSQLHSLFADNYITNSNDYHDNHVYLTDKGKAYVEEVKSEQKYKRHRIFHDWLNTGIAFCALIVAIISLIVSLMR